MSESKHTPGPWFVDYDGYGRPVGITSPNEMSIPGTVGHIVRRNGIGLPSSDTAHANARLIAAAPDLLEACDQLLLLIQYETNLPQSACNGVTDSTGTIDEGEVRAFRIIENARNAVAKAC